MRNFDFNKKLAFIFIIAQVMQGTNYYRNESTLPVRIKDLSIALKNLPSLYYQPTSLRDQDKDAATLSSDKA